MSYKKRKCGVPLQYGVTCIQRPRQIYAIRKRPDMKKFTANIPVIPLWNFALSFSFLPRHIIRPYGTSIHTTHPAATANIENMLQDCPEWIFPNCRSAVPVKNRKPAGATVNNSKFLRNPENFSLHVPNISAEMENAGVKKNITGSIKNSRSHSNFLLQTTCLHQKHRSLHIDNKAKLPMLRKKSVPW